ncbi:DEAD/DEAH box helicase [Bifidobacterium jacchi]|uniref:DEAD/DEAH box helicase n=1 Tax=Bifidobacterium jacchi TaxID=2490545 RepID=UPI003BADA79A
MNPTDSAPADDSPLLEDAVPFAELGVPGPLLRVLAADGKTAAFPIQADTLPDSLKGRDILGRGRTGSGKTLAFCIPLVARLCEAAWEPGMSMADFRRNVKQVRLDHLEERKADDYMPHPRGLVLAPTRELANQINDVLAPLARIAGIDTTTVYGGVRYKRQIGDLKSGADIVVACPGRLEDLIRQQALVLSDVEIVVLDEADEMADMGFLPPVRRILEQIRPDAQHMLFSATLDHGIDELVREFLRDPKTHSVDEPTAAVDTMTQVVFEIDKSDKNEVVRALASGKGRRILFTRTKYQAKNLAKKLTQEGIPAAELHGNLSQNQRDRNLAAFEEGDVNVMVATDVAARGIDVSDVELVVQVDPPEDPKSFVHRSGRTARAGKSGTVVTLVQPSQRRESRRMLKAAGIHVKPVKVRHDSPQLLELVGERAEPVLGWSLDKTQPFGGPHAKNRVERTERSGRSGRSGRSRAKGRRFDEIGVIDAPVDEAKALRHLGQFDAESVSDESGRADRAADARQYDRRSRRGGVQRADRAIRSDRDRRPSRASSRFDSRDAMRDDERPEPFAIEGSRAQLRKKGLSRKKPRGMAGARKERRDLKGGEFAGEAFETRSAQFSERRSVSDDRRGSSKSSSKSFGAQLPSARYGKAGDARGRHPMHHGSRRNGRTPFRFSK